MKMKSIFLQFLAVFFLIPFSVVSQTCILQSPEGHSEIQVLVGKSIEYEVRYKNTPVIGKSEFSLIFSQSRFFGKDVKIIDIQESSVKSTWEPVVGSFKEVLNHYNEKILTIHEVKYE